VPKGLATSQGSHADEEGSSNRVCRNWWFAVEGVYDLAQKNKSSYQNPEQLETACCAESREETPLRAPAKQCRDRHPESLARLLGKAARTTHAPPHPLRSHHSEILERVSNTTIGNVSFACEALRPYSTGIRRGPSSRCYSELHASLYRPFETPKCHPSCVQHAEVSYSL
ncbi:myosin H, partial [Toxoplasma gondii FOU]